MSTTTDSTAGIKFFYVDELQDENAVPTLGAFVRTSSTRFSATRATFSTAASSLFMNKIADDDAPFPKQDFKDAGSSFRMINETERLSEVLASNDELTSVFVTGLVFAYVICLSLPVIFVTACSLYLKRMNGERRSFRRKWGSSHRRANNNHRLGDQQNDSLAFLPHGDGSFPAPLPHFRGSGEYLNSPLAHKVQQAPKTPPPAIVVDPDTPHKQTPNTEITSPSPSRTAAFVRVQGPNRTLIPLKPLFNDWEDNDGQQVPSNVTLMLYDTPPPPDKFADHPPKMSTPSTSLSGAGTPSTASDGPDQNAAAAVDAVLRTPSTKKKRKTKHHVKIDNKPSGDSTTVIIDPHCSAV